MWPARTVRSPEPRRSRPSAPTTSRRIATTSGGSCSTTASPSGRTASRTPVSRCCAGRRGSSPPTRRRWPRRRRCSPAGATTTRRSSTIGSPRRPPARIRPSRPTNATRSRTPGISWCAGSRGTQPRSGSCGCGPASTPCNVESPATRPCWRGCSPPPNRVGPAGRGSLRPISNCSRAIPRREPRAWRSGGRISPPHWDRSPPTRAPWSRRSHRPSTRCRTTSRRTLGSPRRRSRSPPCTRRVAAGRSPPPCSIRWPPMRPSSSPTPCSGQAGVWWNRVCTAPARAR